MAVNEQIVIGRKFRKLLDEATKLWQRISFWTKATDVEFDDGQTAESKMGAIKGITTDLNVTETGYAADATMLTQLYSDIGYKKLQFGQYVFISYAPGEYEIEIPYPHPFNTMPVIVISLGIPHKNFEGYGMTHLSICNEKNTKNKFVVYLKTEYISDCTYAINWVAMT